MENIYVIITVTKVFLVNENEPIYFTQRIIKLKIHFSYNYSFVINNKFMSKDSKKNVLIGTLNEIN